MVRLHRKPNLVKCTYKHRLHRFCVTNVVCRGFVHRKTTSAFQPFVAVGTSIGFERMARCFTRSTAMRLFRVRIVFSIAHKTDLKPETLN